MNAYPLIYSRTKLCDFVTGFLVRPNDLDYTVAERYVKVALNDIKHINGIRHTVFAVGDYLIYGGTACYTSKIISRILNDKGINELDFNYKEYGCDHDHRPIYFFIGFAIKRSDIIPPTLIPDVDLYKTYKIYLEYLDNQWLNSTTMTQTLNNNEAIELNAAEYSESFTPDEISSQGITILKNYDEIIYQNITNYYFHEFVTNPNKDCSFISNVFPEMLTDDFVFKNGSLYGISVEDYLSSLRKEKTKVTSLPANSDDTPQVYYSAEDYSSKSPRPISSHPSIEKNQEPTIIYSSAEQYRVSRENHKEKKMFPPSRMLIIILIIITLVGGILIIGMIITGKTPIIKQKTQNQMQITNMYVIQTTQ